MVRVSPAVRLLALVPLCVGAAGCSPLLYALFSLGEEAEGPRSLVVGQTAQGSTDDAEDEVVLSCGSPIGAGDESWTFVPPATARYRITVNADYDASLGVFAEEPRREIACNDDSNGARNSEVAIDLEAHRRYTVVVDGYHSNEGDYRLSVRQEALAAVPSGNTQAPGVVAAEDAAAMQARCEAAPVLATGVTNGSVGPGGRAARTSCASGPGGDVVYRLALSSAAQVTLKLEATFDGILELRSACSPGPVIACNDDSGDALHSMVAAHLDPGTYFVVVDAYQAESAGQFRLEVIITP